MNHIDADKLKAEIERQLASLNRRPLEMRGDYVEGLIDSFNRTIAFITSLQQEQPEVDLEKAARYVYESWMGGTMDDVRRDMVELGKVLNARKEE